MDPNDLRCTVWKWKHADVSRITDGDLEAALGRIEVKTYVMAFEKDLVFVFEDCREEEAMIPDSELRPIATSRRHFGTFGFRAGDEDFIDNTIRALLDEPV